MSESQISQDQGTRNKKYFELGISLVVWKWDALCLAVVNEWGGPDSAEKRDWLAGEISELFETEKHVEPEDIEDMCIQILSDEFNVVLEEDSAAMVHDPHLRRA